MTTKPNTEDTAIKQALFDIALKVIDDDMKESQKRLATELHARIMGFPELDEDVALRALVDRAKHAMLPWDEQAAAFLEALSTPKHQRGVAAAKDLRAEAKKRWADASSSVFSMWMPLPGGGTRFINVLTEVLWYDVVQPQMVNDARDELVRAARALFADQGGAA